jgi:hypothetical protein
MERAITRSLPCLLPGSVFLLKPELHGPLRSCNSVPPGLYDPPTPSPLKGDPVNAVPIARWINAFECDRGRKLRRWWDLRPAICHETPTPQNRSCAVTGTSSSAAMRADRGRSQSTLRDGSADSDPSGNGGWCPGPTRCSDRGRPVGRVSPRSSRIAHATFRGTGR